MFDFETSVSGIEFKVRQLADEVMRLRTAVERGEDRCRELEEALKNKETEQIYQIREQADGRKRQC